MESNISIQNKDTCRASGPLFALSVTFTDGTLQNFCYWYSQQQCKASPALGHTLNCSEQLVTLTAVKETTKSESLRADLSESYKIFEIPRYNAASILPTVSSTILSVYILDVDCGISPHWKPDSLGVKSQTYLAFLWISGPIQGVHLLVPAGRKVHCGGKSTRLANAVSRFPTRRC